MASAVLASVGLVSVARVSVCSMLSAFLWCLLHAGVFDGARATSTHCRVWNWAPSVSAAIGGSQWVRTAPWRCAVALNSSPRLVFAVMYLAKRRSAAMYGASVRYRWAAILAFAANVAELLGLLLLSLVHSKENYSVSEAAKKYS